MIAFDYLYLLLISDLGACFQESSQALKDPVLQFCLHAKMCEFACKNVRKITITASGFRNSEENPNNSSPVQD